jgi:hypothetical protein
MTKMTQRYKEARATIVKSPQGRSTDRSAIREEPQKIPIAITLVSAEAGA